ncbi:MAG: NfeD family protein [Ruminococcaceae bacterium]|nr:NfeD family protein [Oscillospiraceae bacterium]
MTFLLNHSDILIWLVLMVIFLITEASTSALVSIWFAAGAFVAMLTAVLGLSVWLQILVFLAVSVLVLILAKPFVHRHVNQKVVKTNADRVLDALGTVTVDIDNISSTGQVEVLGQLWSALSESGEPIPKGTIVTVQKIQGVKLLVKINKEG